MKRSTGLRNYMLASGSFMDAMAGKVIKIYTGSVPVSADAALAVGNTLLCTMTVDGDGVTGLTLAPTAAGGQITKNTSEVWEGEIVASDTATFFRHETMADAGALSTDAIRLQGTVSNIGADLNFTDKEFVLGDTRRINYYVAAIPAG